MKKLLTILVVLTFALTVINCGDDKKDKKDKKDVKGKKEQVKKEQPKKEAPKKEEPTKEEPKSDDGSKYPKMNKLMKNILKIAKDNKDKPEEAKKSVQELVKGIDPKEFQEESQKLNKVFTEKMASLEGEKDPSKAMNAMMKVFKEELPAMDEFMKMSMNPEYQKVMAAINQMPELKMLNPMKK